MSNQNKNIDIQKEIIITVHCNEKIRIDKYLSSLGRKDLYSRTFIDKLLINNLITIHAKGRSLENGKIAKKSEILKGNEKIVVKIPIPEEKNIIPENIDLDIVYEDKDIAIINKPAGMVVHPAPGHYKGTLVNALIYHFSKLSNMNTSGECNVETGFITPPKLRPGIVHRLDKNTSGLMIIAKNDYVHSLLKKMFENHKIQKIYLALTMGTLTEKESTIKTFYGRNPKNRQKMAVRQLADGKVAITHYKVLQSFLGFDLTKVYLETGRTHQIRVHFSYIHHPIMGDKIYSTKKQMINLVPLSEKNKINEIITSVLTRQALHAYKLEFIHPITKKKVSVKKDMPEDMKKVMDIFNNM
ncbi:MAG: RluA family pseudouridine synthase [Candidatus Cloacimonetes bacterium]|nr:RluA family pseudouridine synthase [Candidatus Cloacimonadota bacterium]